MTPDRGDPARRRAARASARGRRALLRRRGRADRPPVPPDGRALRPRRAAGGLRRARPPRARTRATSPSSSSTRDRRQAGAAGARAGRRGRPAGRAGRAGGRARRHGRSPSAPRTRDGARRSPSRAERGCLTVAFAPGAAPSGSSCRRATTRSCARSWSRRSTTCCGSSCTSSSSTAGCSRGAPRGPSTTPAPRASSIPSWPSRRTTSTPWSPTCARSVLMKAEEVGALRAQTLARGRADAARGGRGGAARALRRRRAAARARQRRLGHRRDGRRRRLPRAARAAGRRGRALDLTEDPAILTAIANDIGVEAIFARQVIALRARRRRAARALHQRQLGERDRRAGRGAPARPA